MAMIGADPEELDSLGRMMTQSADRLDGIHRELSSALSMTTWSGSDAELFQGDWAGRLAGLLSSVAHALSASGGKLHFEAEQQRNASAAGTDGGQRLPAELRSVLEKVKSLGGHHSARQWGSGDLRASYSASSQFGPQTHRSGTVKVHAGEALVAGTIAGAYGLFGHVQGSAKVGPVEDDFQGSGFVGVRAGASGSARASMTGLDAEGHADVFKGAELTTANSTSAFGVTESDQFVASAGAGANVDGHASLGLDGAKADVNAGAFAGAQASRTESVSGYGAEAGATGHVYAGVGAHVSAEGSFSATDVSFHVDAGVAVGLGAGGGVSVKIDPDQIAHEIRHALPALFR